MAAVELHEFENFGADPLDPQDGDAFAFGEKQLPHVRWRLGADKFEIAAIEEAVDKVTRQQFALQSVERAASFDELIGAALCRNAAAARQPVQQKEEGEPERER